jgi:hypothetical protein
MPAVGCKKYFTAVRDGAVWQLPCLFEMDWLDERLNEIQMANSPSGRARPLELHFHRAYLAEVLLFRPGTVASLLKYVGYANELASRLDRLQSRTVEPGPTWDHELKRLAAILMRQTPAAKAALVNEGGKWSARSQPADRAA